MYSRAGLREVAVTAALGVAVTAASAHAQELTYSGAFQYATGSYVFSERTHNFSLTSSLGLRVNALGVDVTLPIVIQNSTAITYVGGSPLPTGGPDHEVVGRREPGSTIPGRRGPRQASYGSGANRSGTATVQASQADSVTFTNDFSTHAGDPTIRGSLDVYSGSGLLRTLRVTAGLKAPLADADSGVGTGEWDFTSGGSVALVISSVYLLADASYWWLGDLTGLELRDGVSYGLGAGFSVLQGRGSLIATLSGSQATIETVDAPLMVGTSLGLGVGDGHYVSGGLSWGLSEGSPDFGAFLGWSLDL